MWTVSEGGLLCLFLFWMKIMEKTFLCLTQRTTVYNSYSSHNTHTHTHTHTHPHTHSRRRSGSCHDPQVNCELSLHTKGRLARLPASHQSGWIYPYTPELQMSHQEHALIILLFLFPENETFIPTDWAGPLPRFYRSPERTNQTPTLKQPLCVFQPLVWVMGI